MDGKPCALGFGFFDQGGQRFLGLHQLLNAPGNHGIISAKAFVSAPSLQLMKLDFVVYQRHQDGLGIIGGELTADEFMTGLWGGNHPIFSIAQK